MIKNLERTKQFIVDWMKDYAQKAGTKTWVVGLSGGIDSALVALLCKATNIPTICVAMPCHSSGFSLERARNFAKEQNLNLMTVNLTDAYNSILIQMSEDKRVRPLTNEGMNSSIATGGLRSCLRAPTLSYFALATKGIIVGTGNRSEDNLIRYFQKYGDGCVDISPIADLFKSEVYELFAYMTGIKWTTVNGNAVSNPLERTSGEDRACNGPSAALSIYLATPTADLWGENGGQTDEEELGITYDEVEWADRQNENTRISNRLPIITDEGDPTQHPAWAGYTLRQREVIAKVHQMEKITRHKFNPALPVCPIRQQEGLVQ